MVVYQNSPTAKSGTLRQFDDAVYAHFCFNVGDQLMAGSANEKREHDYKNRPDPTL
jgi:hypothetical protein